MRKYALCMIFLQIILFGCKKDDGPPKYHQPLGEVKLVLDQEGNRPIYFSGTPDGKCLLSGALGGSTSVMPFLATLNDSLKVELLASPSANLNMSRGFKAVSVSNGFVMLYSKLDDGDADDLGPVRISKISMDGQIEWEKTYLTNAKPGLKSITRDRDDMIYFLAVNYYPDTTFCSLLKTGNNGDVILEKTMNGINPGDVINTSDDHIIYHRDSVLTSMPGKYFPVITKIDSHGNSLWSLTLSPNNGSAWNTILHPTIDAGCLVVYQPGKDTLNTYIASTIVLKINSSGEIEWQTKLIPKSMLGESAYGGFSGFGGIFVDHNGNNYIVGSVYSSPKLAIAKFDMNGNWIKSVIIGSTQDMEREGIGMTENSKGELIVCARDYRLTSTLPYLYNTVLFKMNEDFEIL